MAIFISLVEVWIISGILRAILSGSMDRSFEWMLTHLILCSILLVLSIASFAYAAVFIKGRFSLSVHAQAIKIVYSLTCISFGMYISVMDYASGEQMLGFMTMILLVSCVIIWRPVVSIPVITFSFSIFYYICDGIAATSMITKLNLLTTYLAACLISLSRYFQWFRECSSKSDLDRANMELEDTNRELEESYIALEDSNQALARSNKDLSNLNNTLSRTNKHLKYVSDRDYLTGLYTPRGFRKICKAIVRSLPPCPPPEAGLPDIPIMMTYVYFDVNNFKDYNGQYGFPVGNIFLKDFARFLEEIFHNEADPNSQYSALSREGNDHFIAFAPTENIEPKIKMAAEFVEKSRKDIYMRLCTGTYETVDPNLEVGIGVDRARLACNRIKRDPRRSVNSYDADLDEKLSLRRYITGHIDQAVENEYIKVFYQPIIDISTGKVVDIEALSRWVDPDKGFLSPADFISTLEDSHQIFKLDSYVAQRACRDHLFIKEKLGEFLPVSINFSRVDFELMDVCGLLCEITDKYGVSHECIEVEVTESALSTDVDGLLKELDRIRDAGFKIWLDDFGSGYSALNTLKDYDFDVVKIDMEFLRNLEKTPNTRVVMENIIALCNDLNTTTLTEGVEIKEHLDFLKDLGCLRAQGYYFSKPVPIDELLELFESDKLKISG